MHFKKDIEAFGLAKYNEECEKFSVDMMNIMNDTFEKLGVWMDFKNAYMPITREFISAEWFLIKRANEQKRLYEGLRTMAWCASCQTNLSKHELEYKNVTDNSVFLKFKVKTSKGKTISANTASANVSDKNVSVKSQNEFLIIWTTTPWTIPFNLAIMVNPELEYVRVLVDGEVWILAKALANMVVSAVANKTMTVLEEFKGESLKGLAYEHPFADVIPEYAELKKLHKKLHTVVLSQEYVDTSAGSGLVHCAPGCGPEDYEVGHDNKLPAWNLINEQGQFPQQWQAFAGLTARKHDAKFIEALQQRGSVIAVTPVEHEYPHCQRCHSPVIFRTTSQWFFRVEDLKKRMIAANKKVFWVPKAGFNAFESWLSNLRDNSITKQNFWGTPVPIWRCDKCKAFDVFGSVDELEQVSKQKISKYHRPWIDEVKYACRSVDSSNQACNGTHKRISDILDVWVDAGTAAWNCLDYPQRTDLFARLFPADFILEGKDQIRGWYNMLMIASILAFGKNSFKAVYMHGFIDDSLGRKMSKSLGNQIEPEEVTNQYGADTLRYYQLGSGLPGEDQAYNPEDAKGKFKNLLILWNTHQFILDLAKNTGLKPGKPKKPGLAEQYILSRTASTVQSVTCAFAEYRLNEIPNLVETLYLDVSRTYIQLIRDKASTGTKKEQQLVLSTLFSCFETLLRLCAPVMPFIAEQMYQNFKAEFGLSAESVHLLAWPKVVKNQLNPVLEEQIVYAQNIIESALHCREQAKIPVRWPLQKLFVVVDEKLKAMVSGVETIIKQQANVKEVIVSSVESNDSGLVTEEFKGVSLKSKSLVTVSDKESSESLGGAISKKSNTNLSGSSDKSLAGGKVQLLTIQTPALEAES
ncbi:MAG: isoleucine--tRNA ligase, partial [Candidatus Woesearchaeota archaeon]|nr:isoleucine--tRNA ligase [Candidatus Woesearchaeota archaeon]